MLIHSLSLTTEVRRSSYSCLEPGLISVALDLSPGSIEDAVGAREGPVKHKPNTTYVKNRLLTVG